MNNVNQSYFSSYIEIDGAFAYEGSDVFTIIDGNSKLFKVSKTIEVFLDDKKDKIRISDNNDFVINNNTILLIENKSNFPKVITDLKRYDNIDKTLLYSSLNFAVYKSIKKINIFREYLNSVSQDKKIEYSYFLLFVYDLNPISQVEKIFINILNNLLKEKLITYPSFHLKVLYPLPCFSFNEIKREHKLYEIIRIMLMHMRDMDSRISNLEKKDAKNTSKES